jgi:hypothetical protein
MNDGQPLALTVRALLVELMPVRGTNVELGLAPDELEPVALQPDGTVRVLLRLQLSDDRGIRDIKEQHVELLRAADIGVPQDRVEAYLRGWCLAVTDLLGRLPIATLEVLMPHDFVRPGVLGLAKPMTPEAFRDALLVRSRLGKLASIR